MRLETFGTAGDLVRATEIGRVFLRHGFGDLLQRTGVSRTLRRAGTALRGRGTAHPDLSPPERLRSAFEELGPTFVKFGQLLAGRTDVFGTEWTSELAKLREHAAPVPWPELRAQLREDLGQEPESVFVELDPTPVAAASIAQVHRARLQDGTPVALKIRRPGIAATVERDLRLIGRVVQLLEHEIPDLRRRRLRDIVRQFAGSLRNELDLSIEARSSQVIARDIAAHDELFVPRVHDRFTTPCLLVEDFVEGRSIDAWLAGGGVDPEIARRVAHAGASVVLEMVFVHGRYHADPHGGNVLLANDGRLALLDFGMIGRLSEARRREFFELLTAFAARDDARLVSQLLAWSGGADVDEDALAADVGMFLDRYHGAKLGEVDLGRLLGDIAAISRDNGLLLPADVSMLLKLFVTLEDLGRSLDPGFEMTAEVLGFIDRAGIGPRSPLAMLRRGVEEVRRVAATLPGDLKPWLSRLRRGHFRIEIELARLDRVAHEIERSVNRLTIGIVTSALIVGTSIALTVSGGPELFGFPALALIGFASSLALGFGLLIAIARSGRD